MTTLAVSGSRFHSRAKTATLWTLQIVSAGMFFLASISKLAGAAAMVQVFAAIGIGQWFRYLTGVIEVVSATLLLVPSLAFYGAALLVPTMVGAVFTHLFVIGGNPVPAIFLLATSSAIALLKWSER